MINNLQINLAGVYLSGLYESFCHCKQMQIYPLLSLISFFFIDQVVYYNEESSNNYNVYIIMVFRPVATTYRHLCNHMLGCGFILNYKKDYILKNNTIQYWFLQAEVKNGRLPQ